MYCAGEPAMINIEAELYDKVESEILKWNEEGIYAISFLVDSNTAYEYRGFENASMWTISYIFRNAF